MTVEQDRGRPLAKSAAPTAITNKTKSTAEHPALIAESAAPWWGTDAWREQILADLAEGLEIAADVVQERHPELPDMGPAVGGVFYGLSASKVLRKVGYRPSRKASRSGSVIAVWTAGERA